MMSAQGKFKSTLLVFGLLFTSVVADANAVPSTIVSPSGKYKIMLTQTPMPGIPALDGDATLAVMTDSQMLSQFPTFGYLADAVWSPDESYVAVNNRRGNQGDYVWVFSLKDGKAIKAPDEIPGEVFADRAARKFTELSVEAFAKWWNVAKEWKGPNELEIWSRLVFSKSKHVVIIDRVALYRVKAGGLVQVDESFERAGSSERSP